MNASSVKKPTSSTTGPTATTSVKSAGKRVSINDGEDVFVSPEFEENFYATTPTPVPDSVFKCNGCSLLSVHQGYEFICVHAEGAEAANARRVYMCTNCGRFATK